MKKLKYFLLLILLIAIVIGVKTYLFNVLYKTIEIEAAGHSLSFKVPLSYTVDDVGYPTKRIWILASPPTSIFTFTKCGDTSEPLISIKSYGSDNDNYSNNPGDVIMKEKAIYTYLNDEEYNNTKFLSFKMKDSNSRELINIGKATNLKITYNAGSCPWFENDYTDTFNKIMSSITFKEALPQPNNGSQGKLNIDVVCTSALSYMTFENGEASDKFISECKEGKYPDVIERYKKDMNLGDGVAI